MTVRRVVESRAPEPIVSVAFIEKSKHWTTFIHKVRTVCSTTYFSIIIIIILFTWFGRRQMRWRCKSPHYYRVRTCESKMKVKTRKKGNNNTESKSIRYCIVHLKWSIFSSMRCLPLVISFPSNNHTSICCPWPDWTDCGKYVCARMPRAIEEKKIVVKWNKWKIEWHNFP